MLTRTFRGKAGATAARRVALNFLVVIGAAAGLLFLAPSLGPGAAAPPAENEGQTLDAALRGEARILLFSVRLGLGERFDCIESDGCARLTTFRDNLNLVIERCSRMWPVSAWRGSTLYTAEAEGVISALERACSTVRVAQRELGEPTMSNEWLAAAREARAFLAH